MNPPRLEPFKASALASMGVELELQLIDAAELDLAQCAEDLLPVVLRHNPPGEVKPEITESMLEIATSVQTHYSGVIAELQQQRDALVKAAKLLDVRVAGGGTHAFQSWAAQRIAAGSPRFAQLSALYGYLAKQFTVFGQHVHLGCPNPNDALWLLHAMSRYIPQFIALASSSPFVQGQDTGFASARLNSVSAFPLSGRAPFVLTWAEFEAYFERMARTGVVKSMKDFYWDIRPKPEYGTIEIRVFDTPLSVGRAAAWANYAQALARWLLAARPHEPSEDDYLVYSYNRFQACRFGLDGNVVDPCTGQQHSLRRTVAATLNDLLSHPQAGLDSATAEAVNEVLTRGTDAERLRQQFARRRRWDDVVHWQADQFAS